MKKFKLIVPSFIALIFCMLLIAGSTFALFTSEAEASISVTSAKVKYEAELTKVQLYHVMPDSEGTILDENGETYSHVEGSFWYADALQATSTATAVDLKRMVPGDKAVYKLTATNTSNVKTKYRVRMYVTENTPLASAMEVTVQSGDLQLAKDEGMVSYQTAWTEQAANTNVELTWTFELPLKSGNTFQDSEVKYNFLVEAVQGNAATSGSENYETIDLYVEEAKSEAQEISTAEATVVALEAQGVEVAPNENLKVNVSIPAENTFKNAADEEMTVTSTSLKVSDLFVSSNNETNETTIAADVKLLDQDGKEIKSVDPEKPVTVNVYVGEGFNSVKVKHNGTLVEGSTYDPSTGYVTFSTASFSPFEFIGDFAALIGTKYYGTFEAAYADANENNTVVLLKDVEFTDILMVGKSVNIEGNGHKMTSCGNRIIRVTAPNINITISNLDMISTCTATNGGLDSESHRRGISFDGASSNTTLTLNNVSLKSAYDDYPIEYAINTLQKSTGLTINILNGSYIQGWAAVNSHSKTSTYLVKDSTLHGINIYSGASNSFATFVFDGNNLYSTGNEEPGAYNSSVTFVNSVIIAEERTEQKQFWISFQYGAENNNAVVSVDKDTKILSSASGENKVSVFSMSGIGNRISVKLSDAEKAQIQNKGYLVTANNDGSYTIECPQPFMVQYYGEGFSQDINFADAFNYGWFMNNEHVLLKSNVTLYTNLPASSGLNSGETIYIHFESYEITGGTITLATNTTCVTDKNVDGLFVNTNGNVISAVDNGNGTFSYIG